MSARDWSPEVLDALDLDRDWLPRTFEGPEVTGTITTAAADATDLVPRNPVVAGGGDQAANAVGVGAIDPGTMALSLGTSGVVFAPTDAPRIAAGSLRWSRDALAPEQDFASLTDEAASAPAGSDGLWFLPYLTGERTPHPDPDIRGAFIGLDIQHRRPHLTRAILEGVAFGLRDGLDPMLEARCPRTRPDPGILRRDPQPPVAPDPG